MKRAVLASCVALLAGGGAAGGMAACSSSSGGGSSSDAGKSDVVTIDASPGSFTPEIACTDSIDSIYAAPDAGIAGLAKGAIMKCAHDQDLTAAQLYTAAQADQDAGNLPYSGPMFTSGARVYRVLYRTERGDPNNTPGYSSALLFLPETPRLGDGTKLPIIVAAHGSRGQAGKCAPSLNDPAAEDVEEDFVHLVYPLVGFGFPVIAPDLAGYANFGAPGNPPPSYDDYLDVGKSMLDGARAARVVIPSSLDTQVVIAGHSQGGYTAMAALALADSYGAGGSIAAVAVYSPLWLSQQAWAAIFAEPTVYTFAQSSAGPVSVWYHYTHSYLLDGPDAALELFKPEAGAAVQNFVNDECWGSDYPALEEAGLTGDAGSPSANDFFSNDYVAAMKEATTTFGKDNCAGILGNEQPELGLCQTWTARMIADYPHMTGGAAKVPILLWYANADTTITPDAMQCVLNRLTGDQTNLKLCYDTNPVGHGGVLSENAGYVADWIAQQTLPDAGAPAMGNCSALPPNDAGVPQLSQPDGAAIPCNSLLPQN